MCIRDRPPPAWHVDASSAAALRLTVPKYWRPEFTDIRVPVDVERPTNRSAGILRTMSHAKRPPPPLEIAHAVHRRGGGLLIMPNYEEYRPGGPLPKPRMILTRGSPTATPDDPSETPRSESPIADSDEPIVIDDGFPPAPSQGSGE